MPDSTTDLPSTSTVERIAPWLALGCVIGPALFTIAWFVLGFVSPGYEVGGDWISPFSAITQPISGLGMGETAPYMNAAFILGGLITIVGVAGTMTTTVTTTVAPQGRAAATRSAALLALSPLGLAVAGVFTLDAPATHFAGFFLVAATPAVSFPVAGVYFRTIPRWRRFGTWLLAAGPVTLLFLAAYLLSFDRATTAANEGIAGLTSRLLGLAVQVWYVAMGWRAFREHRR